MSALTLTAAALAALFTLNAAGAMAQDASRRDGDQQSGWLEGLGKDLAPLVGVKPSTDSAKPKDGDPLTSAFKRLASPNARIAAKAHKEILTAWGKSGSASMDLLILRGQRAVKKKKWGIAEEHFSQLVNLAPEYAHGWVLRASVRMRKGEIGLALADAAQALTLEPRHFDALMIAGAVYYRIDKKKEALAAAEAALKLYPHLAQAKVLAAQVRSDLEGVDV
ncbi:MAG: hypothetical protein MRY74_06105 [Neomegalonema sp.]|nr:hypothetical protein [Neomegalonema sp.]